ncbi:HNH endonuclease [Phormidium sp. FACHB-322]|nr:HNH endonuclease [Phormidium sp. FACHB-77]MBD2028858.1 HNH endonuclease [Phormidium sp. FACHB-322]MBD2049238.1 HNH endonuclease [Leptolyngbya sp. FACHB-60]
MGKALEEWQGTIAALGTSGMVTANALQDLPRTAQELAQEMPALARRLQRAGTRLGDAPRSDADMMGLFDKIPGTSKLGASERDIRVFLSDKHGSHVQAHSKGGSNGAENIVWELGADNIRRGAATMTGGEQTYIRFYNAVDSVLKNSTTIAQLGLAATGTAILAQALVTALAYTLDLYRGDITADEFRDKIVAAAISAGIATPIFFLILVAVMALFPEIVVVLSAPAVILGFNALFGVGVALPIVQSIVRHVEAGGCGDEAKAQYAKAIAQGNALLETSSLEVQRWWQQLFAADPVLENEAIAET